jgi:hypothetical protein
LSLRSDRPIPGLLCSGSRRDVDVEVRVGTAPPLLREMPPPLSLARYLNPLRDVKGNPTLAVWEVNGGRFFRLRYADGTEFLVARSGAAVWATWPEPLTLDDTATYLLGPILGFVLRLRGFVCLHASGVALGGLAVALVGQAGAGKSTVAAAFARSGARVLSDDVVPLDDRGGTLLVQPGNPRLRLWSTSAQILFGSPDALPRLTPNWDKLYLDLGGDDFAFQKTPLPLGAVYVLGPRSGDTQAPFVEQLSPQQAMMELVGNTYVNYLLDGSMRAREFAVLGRLLRSVPVARVVPHEDPASLSTMCQVILEDLHRLSSRPEPSDAHR